MTLCLIIPESKRGSLSSQSEETFLKRIKSYVKTQVLTFKPEKNGNTEFKQSKDQQKILKLIPKEAKVIVCDELGESLNTKKLLNKVEKLFQQSTFLVFVIGGPYGLSEELKDSVDLKLRLSDLTMNSDLACSVLWEQLYRIFSLRAGHPYHNE